MAPGPSADTADAALLVAHGPTLLGVAARSIRHGLDHGKPLLPALDRLAPDLAAVRASFVTLEIDHELRGCIGSVAPHRPLAHDVAENAFAAAFRDPRFAALAPDEWPRTTVALSLLGPLQPIAARRRDEVVRAIRPHVDGLVLHCGRQRGLFLPQVWDTVPEPESFVGALLRKAGFAPDEWPDGMAAEVFQVAHTGPVRLAEAA
jgi:AmmeMemoRadiSam system protein A